MYLLSTSLIINLFGYDYSVIKFGLLIQSMHSKHGSYKEGTKNVRIYRVVEPKHFVMRISLDFDKILLERFTQEKPFTPGVYRVALNFCGF